MKDYNRHFNKDVFTEEDFRLIERSRRSKRAANIVSIIITAVVVGFVIFPFIWIVPAAFKERTDLWNIPPRWLPTTSWTFESFIGAFKVNRKYNLGKSLIATALVAVISTITSLFVNTLAAYAFARIEFPFKKLIWTLYLIPMFIPGITILLTSLQVIDFLAMKNTIFVLFVPSMASAYRTFFFRQFFLSIPSSFEEAAQMDGCNHFRIYYKIFLPTATTPLIIQGMGVFMAKWNSFMWPALTITDNVELQQVMQVVKIIRESATNNFGIVIGAALVAMLPPLIIFSVLQKKIVQGITLSGIK